MSVRRSGLLLTFLALGVPFPAAAQGTDAPPPPVTTLEAAAPPDVSGDGEPGASETRGGVFGGLLYGTLAGSEVEKADPGPGVQFGGFWRVWHRIAAWGSLAASQHDVNGQVTQLLDQPLRSSGRSGHVEGNIRIARARLGVRLEGVRQADWKVVPYAVAAVCFSKVEVTVDSIDGQPPAPVASPAGGPSVDVSKFDETQIGGLARFGLEYDFTANLALDVHGSYEVFEFPAGTNASILGGAAAVIRF